LYIDWSYSLFVSDNGHISIQHWYPSAKLDGVTSQKFIIYNILKYHILRLQGCLISDVWSALRKWRATQSYSWRTTRYWTRKL